MPSQKYDDEPVFFCKRCLSLKISYIVSDYRSQEYCDSCGATDIGKAPIEKWEQYFTKKYGKKYLDIKTKKNGK